MNTNTQLFGGLTPLIQVFDMPHALAFYRDLLGFGVVSASPEVETPEGRFSHWTRLLLGAADLMLNAQGGSRLSRQKWPDMDSGPLAPKTPTAIPLSFRSPRVTPNNCWNG